MEKQQNFSYANKLSGKQGISEIFFLGFKKLK